MQAANVVVLVSARTEWAVVRRIYADITPERSPYGEWFQAGMQIGDKLVQVVFLHGGWGKVAAAGSTQYAIDHWGPRLLVNLGTCGGFEGQVEVGMLILAERTLIYDIYDQMFDEDLVRRYYATDIDLAWLAEPYPQPVLRTLLVSADRDLQPGQISELHNRYGAVAGDWESGAIAYIAARNNTRLLILRGVSDLVGESGGEAYEVEGLYEGRTSEIMEQLCATLPQWVAIGL